MYRVVKIQFICRYNRTKYTYIYRIKYKSSTMRQKFCVSEKLFGTVPIFCFVFSPFRQLIISWNLTRSTRFLKREKTRLLSVVGISYTTKFYHILNKIIILLFQPTKVWVVHYRCLSFSNCSWNSVHVYNEKLTRIGYIILFCFTHISYDSMTYEW